MQAAGGLKKKRRRNLAKVTASEVILYDRDADIFDPYVLNPPYQSHQHYGNAYVKGGSNGSIAIRMSPASPDRQGEMYPPYQGELEGFRYGKSARVTRDPRFTSSEAALDIENDWNISQRPTSAWSGDSRTPHHNNPVLLSDNSIARLRHIMILGITSFAFPWSWNKKTQQIDKWSPGWEKLWRVIWTFTTIQSACICIFQFYSFFSRINTDESGSWRPVFMSSFSVLWYCYSGALNICMYYYRDAMRNVINSIFNMNRKLVDEYLISTDGRKEGGQVLLNISIPTNITQTFISISLFLTFPNSPWYLYHYIYSPDHGWWWLIPGACQEFVTVGQTLSVYLLIAWIVVAHANSVEFWLQEAHKLNESDMTRDELREPHNAVKVYRSLQVMTVSFNETMSPMAISINKWINWSALIPCGFVLIRSMDGKFMDEFPGILTYPFGVIDCVTCPYGLLQMAARMFDISASFLTTWSQTRHKALRKILISCPVLKVKIGRFYYITTSTTITYFKSALDYIINAIVSFP